MTISAGVWEHIRSQREPSGDAIADVAAQDPRSVGRASGAALRERLEVDVLGLGPLSELVEDISVTDVLVNGVDGVWVDRGHGVERTQVEVGDADAVRRLAVRLATLAGRRLDDSSPCVDGQLPDGVRLHAVLPPLVAGAAHLSLRVPARRQPNVDDLAAAGALGPAGVALLRALVASRLAFVITGGTGSGKTTLLGALLQQVDPAERIVLIEDVRELSVEHPHVVRLEARRPNLEGAGAVDLAALVRQALRMRPDRVVVGEVRGAEVRELLTALNTGHDGGCGTLHANTAGDVVARLEALGALADLSPEAVRTQVASAIDVVLHLRRVDGRRVLDEVGVFERVDDTVTVTAALTREGSDLVPAAAYDRLVARLAEREARR